MLLRVFIRVERSFRSCIKMIGNARYFTGKTGENKSIIDEHEKLKIHYLTAFLAVMAIICFVML